MVASNYAFTNAWGLLKALPEEQGYLGTVPRPLQGLIARRGGQMGDVRHEPTFRESLSEEGTVIRDPKAVDLPVEVGEGEGERVPRGIKPLRQDITPIQERQPTMQGYSAIAMTPKGPETVGPEGLTEQQKASMIRPETRLNMANIPGYEMMPEESFYTPREQMEAREGMEQAAGRQLTGGQRGGRMSMTGGGKSGIYAPLRGRADDPTTATFQGTDFRGKRVNPAATRRRATTLGNVEGVSRGAKLGGRSMAFLPQSVKDAQRPPTQAERLAEMAREAAMNNPNMQIDLENLTPPPKEEDKTPREEDLQTGGRAARAAQRVAESKEAQSVKPRLDFDVDPMTQEMFADPSGTAAQAAMGELEGRMQAAEKSKFQQQLAELARRQGRGGSAEQSQIDREA